jgi:hypothetical protein
VVCCPNGGYVPIHQWGHTLLYNGASYGGMPCCNWSLLLQVFIEVERPSFFFTT